MKVRDVLDYLWTLAPLSCKESWDNVGFLCGHEEAPVTRVLVALDAAQDVAQEAEALGCELVVTHHPLIFKGAMHVTDRDITGQTLLAFAERRLAVISMHTNLDCAEGGVNDVLAQRLGLREIEVLPDGETAGLIRCGIRPEESLDSFAAFVKQTLCCPGLRFVRSGRPVRRVAVGGGSCGEFLERVCDAGCDTFVTADVKYHTFCEAKQLGVNLIDAGHYETEQPVCEMLAQKLRGQLAGVEILLSAHRNYTEFL